MKLGPNAKKQAHERELEALEAVPTHEMKGLLR